MGGGRPHCPLRADVRHATAGHRSPLHTHRVRAQSHRALTSRLTCSRWTALPTSWQSPSPSWVLPAKLASAWSGLLVDAAALAAALPPAPLRAILDLVPHLMGDGGGGRVEVIVSSERGPAGKQLCQVGVPIVKQDTSRQLAAPSPAHLLPLLAPLERPAPQFKQGAALCAACAAERELRRPSAAEWRGSGSGNACFFGCLPAAHFTCLCRQLALLEPLLVATGAGALSGHCDQASRHWAQHWAATGCMGPHYRAKDDQPGCHCAAEARQCGPPPTWNIERACSHWQRAGCCVEIAGRACTRQHVGVLVEYLNNIMWMMAAHFGACCIVCSAPSSGTKCLLPPAHLCHQAKLPWSFTFLITVHCKRVHMDLTNHLPMLTSSC